jgi:hypothetical protein
MVSYTLLLLYLPGNSHNHPVYRSILVGKPEGKRPLVGPKRRLEDNIERDLREIEWGGMYWIYLAQDRDQ